MDAFSGEKKSILTKRANRPFFPNPVTYSTVTFIYQFIHSFIHLFVCSFIHSFIQKSGPNFGGSIEEAAGEPTFSGGSWKRDSRENVAGQDLSHSSHSHSHSSATQTPRSTKDQASQADHTYMNYSVNGMLTADC